LVIRFWFDTGLPQKTTITPIGDIMNEKYFKIKSLQPNSENAWLLSLLGDVGGGRRAVNILIPDSSGKRDTFLRSISSLSKKRIIEIKNKSLNSLKIKLTDLGKIEFLCLKLKNVEKLPKNLACLAVFDIPEKQRNIRGLLRVFFRENSFLPLQKSVWISDYNFTESLTTVFGLVGLNKLVKFFTVLKNNCRQ